MKPILILKDFPELDAASEALIGSRRDALKELKELEEKHEAISKDLHGKFWDLAYAILEQREGLSREACLDRDFTTRDGVLYEREEEDVKKDSVKGFKDLLKSLID